MTSNISIFIKNRQEGVKMTAGPKLAVILVIKKTGIDIISPSYNKTFSNSDVSLGG